MNQVARPFPIVEMQDPVLPNTASEFLPPRRPPPDLVAQLGRIVQDIPAPDHPTPPVTVADQFEAAARQSEHIAEEFEALMRQHAAEARDLAKWLREVGQQQADRVARVLAATTDAQKRLLDMREAVSAGLSTAPVVQQS